MTGSALPRCFWPGCARPAFISRNGAAAACIIHDPEHDRLLVEAYAGLDAGYAQLLEVAS